jgi:YD repeat-containing protein
MKQSPDQLRVLAGAVLLKAQKLFFSACCIASLLISPTIFALDSVPPNSAWADGCNVPGYFQTPQAVCDARGALIGRTLNYFATTNTSGKCATAPNQVGEGNAYFGYYCPSGYYARGYTNSNICGETRLYFGNAVTCSCLDGQRYFSDVQKCVSVRAVNAPNKPSDNGPNCTQPSCGEPIDPGTRNMWHIERDMSGTVATGELALVRTYNSSPYNWDATVTRGFGTRWTHVYDVVLAAENPYTPGTLPGRCWERQDTFYVWCENPWPATQRVIPQAVSVLRGDGKKYLFNQSGDTWIGDADTNGRLIATYNSDSSAVLSWTYISEQGDRSERFDASGKLLSISARNGPTQTLTYSDGVTNETRVGRWPTTAPVCSHVHAGGLLPAGRLLCVTDSWGRQVQFEYDTKGRIIQVLDPSGNAWLYEYDGPSGGCSVSGDTSNRACSANNLTKVTAPDGKNRTYYYNEAAQINGGSSCSSAVAIGNGFGPLLNSLTGIVDENGARHITWTYDCQGRATSSQLATGINKVALTYADYDSSGAAVSTITHYVGNPASPQTTIRTYRYKKVLGAAKNTSIDQPCVECGDTKTRTYDANGNITSRTNWNGNLTCYGYDLTRNLETARVEGLASSASCPTMLSATSLTASARKITTQWHATYRLPTLIAEPKRIINNTYDAKGNLLSRSIQATTDANGVQGFAATISGAAAISSYTHNDFGQVLTATDPRGGATTYSYDTAGNLASVTNAAGHVTSLSDYDANGRVSRIVEPNGVVTALSYSPRGWLTSRTTAGETTSYEYDGVGQLKKVTLPNGAYLTYTYDDAHRLTSTADSMGNSINYTLDALGNRTKEEVRDPSGVLTRQITRAYDVLNQLKEITGGVQ